jgi:hypothetical protein
VRSIASGAGTGAWRCQLLHNRCPIYKMHILIAESFSCVAGAVNVEATGAGDSCDFCSMAGGCMVVCEGPIDCTASGADAVWLAGADAIWLGSVSDAVLFTGLLKLTTSGLGCPILEKSCELIKNMCK